MQNENDEYFERGVQAAESLGDFALLLLRQGRTQEEMERILIAIFRQKIAAAKLHPLAYKPIPTEIPADELIALFEAKREAIEAGEIAPNWRYTEDS